MGLFAQCWPLYLYNVTSFDRDRQMAMGERTEGRYLTIIYPDELNAWLSGPDRIRDIVTAILSSLLVAL